MSSMSRRIKEIRFDKNLSQVKFAKALDVTSASISYYEAGKRQPDSAFLFRETVLKQLVDKAIKEKAKLLIDLAGTHGYAPSFLEEAFGGLIREGYFSIEELLKVIEVKCDEMPLYADKVIEFIKGATKKK